MPLNCLIYSCFVRSFCLLRPGDKYTQSEHNITYSIICLLTNVVSEWDKPSGHLLYYKTTNTCILDHCLLWQTYSNGMRCTCVSDWKFFESSIMPYVIVFGLVLFGLYKCGRLYYSVACESIYKLRNIAKSTPGRYTYNLLLFWYNQRAYMTDRVIP